MTPRPAIAIPRSDIVIPPSGTAPPVSGEPNASTTLPFWMAVKVAALTAPLKFNTKVIESLTPACELPNCVSFALSAPKPGPSMVVGGGPANRVAAPLFTELTMLSTVRTPERLYPSIDAFA